MKRYLLFPLLACTLLGADSSRVRLTGRDVFSVPETPATSYLVDEAAEGSGNPANWVNAGTFNWDEATIYNQGSQSLHVNGTAETSSSTSPTVASTADAWIYFQIYIPAYPDANKTLVLIRNGTATQAGFGIDTAGSVIVNHGSATSAATTDPIALNTWTHVWLHFVQGTGADGVITGGFSSTGTKPTSGTKYTSVAAGTTTLAMDRVRFSSTFAATGISFYVDRILVDDASIGDSP